MLFCDTPTSACLRAFATDASWNILPRAPSSHPEPLLLLPPQRGLRDHPSRNRGTPSLCISVALDVLVPLDCTPSFDLYFLCSWHCPRCWGDSRRQSLPALPRGHILVWDTDEDKASGEGGEFGGGDGGWGPHRDSGRGAGTWRSRGQVCRSVSGGGPEECVFIVALLLAPHTQ